MTDDAARTTPPSWLLEPPEPGRIHVYLQVGDDTVLPPGFVEALDALLRSLEGGDVSGYRLGAGCDPFSCTGHTTNPCFEYRTCPTLTSPCAAKLCMPYTCRVETFRRLA